MKKNELVPVGNGESFTRCGWIRLALKTLFEDPHASFFVETIPLCVQLNLIVLLRLAIVGAFSLEIPRLFAVILGLFITTLIYSTSVAAKLWFLSPTRLQKIGVVIILCGGLYPNFVSSKFVIACAALAELYPLSAKEFAKPVLQMAEKFHSFNTFDLKQIGFGRRRQVSDLPKCLQDLCLFFYSEISVYWSLAVTAESNAERQLIARAAIKKASTLAYLPCHADIDLKLLDLIHIAYTDGIQKSDLYRYDSQTFNIIISGETGELLCKYDES